MAVEFGPSSSHISGYEEFCFLGYRFLVSFCFLEWGETHFTWCVGHCLAYDECGAVGRMRICRGNQSTR
jgi:hypothetical protein